VSKLKVSKVKLGFVVVSIATMIWGIAFHNTFQEYRKYCEWVIESEVGLPEPCCTWNGGLYVIITTELLLLAWIPLIGYSVREKVYPYLRRRLSYQEVKGFYRSASRLTYNMLYGSVLCYFKSVNRKARSGIADWSMRCETLQHVGISIKVFKWVVLPASLLYVCVDFCFLGQNALDSMFLGVLIFFYSNFLPDIPSICRRKIYHDIRGTTEDLTWYKKYALLLFAPLFIVAFYCGTRLGWKTTETFHNFKSLAIYALFLFTLSALVFGSFTISIGNITEILSLPFYGSIGYLTHLKVDLCF
jgi:hypothetical protein